MYGTEVNYSERYIGILAGNDYNGNNPHKVIEVIRKEAGCLPDDMLPFSEDITTWEQYYSPKPMESRYLRVGKKWLEKYSIKHDWVFTQRQSLKDKQENMKLSLMSSPLGVSVMAWRKEGEYYTKPIGGIDNHWCTVYGYVDGEYWKVFDHYDDSYKKLAWDYDFNFAKRYVITKTEPKVSWWQPIINYIREILR
jgi:hypothetical protein